MSYETDNWPKLSPAFRAAHNRLRVTKGMALIPEPKIDMYVPPRGPAPKPFDPGNPEFIAAAREFNGGYMPGAFAQGEGFTINGQQVSFALNETERKIASAVRQKARSRDVEDGFKINGRSAR